MRLQPDGVTDAPKLSCVLWLDEALISKAGFSATSAGMTKVRTFDFPVTTYYSQMPAAERGALEQELQDALRHVEQCWFSSESTLQTVSTSKCAIAITT